MRMWNRSVAVVLLLAFAAAPIGVAAEGYVCLSGKRMSHAVNASACTHCRVDAPSVSGAAPGGAARASFERPCCTYVGSRALPPVLTVGLVGAPSSARATVVATPGVTAFAGAARAITRVPQYESGGTGTTPPPLTLQTPILRN